MRGWIGTAEAVSCQNYPAPIEPGAKRRRLPILAFALIDGYGFVFPVQEKASAPISVLSTVLMWIFSVRLPEITVSNACGAAEQSTLAIFPLANKLVVGIGKGRVATAIDSDRRSPDC